MTVAASVSICNQFNNGNLNHLAETLTVVGCFTIDSVEVEAELEAEADEDETEELELVGASFGSD
jgi:hypothetical protein